MKKILIVDDDAHIGDMLEETLSKENYGVLRAYSGTEALLILSSQRPDLVLLDLMLPGLSGGEVLTGTTVKADFEQYNNIYIGENLSDIYHFIFS